MVGSGALDLGNIGEFFKGLILKFQFFSFLIGVMPTNRKPTSKDLVDYGFKSIFSHQEESSSPGYYSVLLLDSNVKAEMTATQLCAFHKYSWLNEMDSRFVTFNISTALQGFFNSKKKKKNILPIVQIPPSPLK